MVIFRFFLSKVLGPSVASKFFFWTKHDKKINFRLFWIQQVQIVIDCHVYFQRNTRNTEGSFWYKSVLSMYFSTIFQKLGFRISSFLSEIILKPITTCTRWIQKSLNVIFLSCFVQERNSPGHTRLQNFGQKNRKMTIFKANFRLVKIVIV
jgi:hypothetical protein